ncbi:MAG: mechanosensitive ion channel [Gemmatimonadota bacterium]|nr:mechanosensitive ion channel [Gemmatimonadota bacterium]
MALQVMPLGAQVASDSAAVTERLIYGLTPETQTKILLSACLVAALVIGRRILVRVVERRFEHRALVYRWSKASGYAAFLIGLLVIMQVWFTALRSLGTFLGLVSAGLAIALKDLVADVAGWLFILWRKPFELGDRIQVGERAGDVVDVRLFQFTIMEIGNWVEADQSTGRMIHIPNSKVFTESLANYTSGFPFLWNELPVLVTFESDWRKAKAVLEEVALAETRSVSEEAERTLKQTSKRFLIHYSRFTPAVYTSLGASGVSLTIRYLCRPRQRRGTAQAIWERIFDTFATHDDIAFAYSTQRVYLNPLEGKADARAPWIMPHGTDTPR